MTPEQREQRRAYAVKYRAAHSEKVRAASAAYYAAHRAELREKRRVYGIAYYAAHREEMRAKHRAYGAAYRAEHREELRAKGRAYSAEHREEERARSRAHVAASPPVVYVWMAPDGHADYVGRGTTARTRVHKNKLWWTPEHLLLSMTCDSEWQAMEYEGRWGAFYQPRHNKEGYRHAA